MSENNNTDRYAIEQAIARLDADKNRVDAFMVHVKWIVSVVSGIVIAVVGLVSFLGITNISDVSKQLAENAESQVRIAIDKDKENLEAIKDLNKDLEEARAEYKKNKESIDALAILKELEGVDRQDPHFAYKRLERLETEEPTPADRGTALKLIAIIVKAGEEGLAEPTLLFNAAESANKLNFEQEAVKLAVLAEHWRPSLAHRALRAQTTEVFGRTFKLVEGSLQQMDTAPDKVRGSAWKDLLDMVIEAPRVEGELIYARASNVAARNRGAGYYEQLVDAILKSEKLYPEKLTSYAYITLADIYARQGAVDWKDKYRAAMEKSVNLHKEESPAATWYGATQERLLFELES